MTRMAGEPAFRVVAASTIADAGFFRVEDVEVEGPDGELHQRYVVRHPGAVVVVPIEDDGEHVLLVRQYRAAINADAKAGEAHNNLAVVLMMKAQYADALAELKAAEKAGFRVNPELRDQIKSRMGQ